METLERLAASDLRATVHGYRDALRAHQEVINRLNVYPVPDGDTGTNMALTVESVVAELQAAGEDDMAATCKAISHGSLMGARGNSGVILSQILRGLAEGFREREAGSAETLAAALCDASEKAYAAVMRPVEGTILTVVRTAAHAAREAAAAGKGLVNVLDAAKEAGAAALAATPDMLPALKQAGVVDAGGAGLLLLIDAFLLVTAGRPLPEPPELPVVVNVPVGMHDAVQAVHDGGPDVSGLRYEVMYFLDAPDAAVPAFREVWAGIGDSIVVVGGDGTWNCHIHTDDIGAAIEAALDVGRPSKIRVTDLLEQVEEERWVREAHPLDVDDLALEEPVGCAVVAVGTGEGIRRIFRSLGVHHIVAGGQSMNPSTAQILDAVESVPSSDVVILPNNKNIIPVAEQVAELTTKSVRVVGTRGIAEGFAALLEYDPEASAEDNARTMGDSATRIVAGEVTQAVRDSDSDAGPIRAGDWIGLARDGIRVVGENLEQTTIGLLDQLVGEDHEIVTLIEGDGASPAVTRRITEWLADRRPDVTAEVHHGGQPLYPYLLSIE